MNILVTGGTGFIGSHIVVELLQNNHNVIIVDNLCNSSIKVLERVKTLTNIEPGFYKIDVRNYDEMRDVFVRHSIDAIIHFAGLKSGAESIDDPGLYFDVNINSTFTLLKLIEEFGVKKFVFSSSATVYGTPLEVPDLETDLVGKVNSPYGLSKYLIELLLKDFAQQREDFKIIALRYFNPIGAHPSGLLGEDSRQKNPNNLVPYITKVLLGQLPFLNVYGDNYSTIDGTGLRDYIHVVDLATGHLAALNYLDKMNRKFDVFNLGTGKGTTVIQLIKAFEEASNIRIPYKVIGVRPGDVPLSYASVEKARNELNWVAKYDYKICAKDSWNWQKNNPNGYE